jgi:hypothetical protein
MLQAAKLEELNHLITAAVEGTAPELVICAQAKIN